MNALTPHLAAPVAPALADPENRLLSWQDDGRTLRLIRRLSALVSGGVLAVALVAVAWRGNAAVAGAWATGLIGVVLGALLLSLTGLLAVLPVVRARLRWVQPAPVLLAPVSPAGRRWTVRLRRPGIVDPALRLARTARRPQGIIVPLVAGLAAAAVWGSRPGVAGPPPDAVLAGAVLLGLTFPLLVAERVMAAVPHSRLPEGASLRALLFIPVIVIPAGSLLHAASGAGLSWAMPAMLALGLFLCLVAAELALRAGVNWFLPPPAPEAARAAVGSVTALLLQPRLLAAGGIAAPLRTHLGLDFSRSWALRYARAAALPVGLGIGTVAWGLSGVALIGLDQRAVYERLGVPTAVWQPGAHVGLPWPLGRVIPVELGVIHAASLGGMDASGAPPAAEAPPPASADRLWDGAHPAEVSFIIAAADASGAQSFQAVSLDLRVLYRFGLDDAAAVRAAYATTTPDALVRSEAGRLMSRFFAGQPLSAILGEGLDAGLNKGLGKDPGADRAALSGALRRDLQTQMDRLATGIDIVAMVIEAVHPPAAAAEAYHNVQAAEIIANTAVATERGRAQASAAMARQTGTDMTNSARGAAAETMGQAAVMLRGFTADQGAASVGGPAFLMERYFANLSVALARAPLVILDHRLGGADAPVVDLRPSGGAARAPEDD